MAFVPQLAAFDLGYIVRRAYEVESPISDELLEEALAIQHTSQGEVLPMVVKAKLILGGFFLEHKLPTQAARVQACLQALPAEGLLG